ncbi:MAG: hypothetical protein ACPG32_15355 [Akkermansiaceae bacterium]
MHPFKQTVVIFAVLAAFGAAKLRFEHTLTADMRESQLLQPKLKTNLQAQVGQTSYAVALGGLRSAVAAFMNLKAFNHFDQLDWIKLEETYNTITELQPKGTYYWDTGAWHLHTNAAVYYQENEDLHPLRRYELHKQYVIKGSDLLEEGVKQNPDNWRLHVALAKVWSDYYKYPDLPRTIKHYEDAIACKSMPASLRKMYTRFLFYTMTRVPDRHEEALAMGRELFKDSRNHLPNLVCCIYALQHTLNVPENQRIPDEKLFPNKSRELMYLKNFQKHQHLGYPMEGVGWKIELLEKELKPAATPSR